MQFSAQSLRKFFGEYPTGVAVVTACDEQGEAVGMVVGSFGSASLDPPLVTFMPSKTSATWSKLRNVESYCVNILGAHQLDVCNTLSSKRIDKFNGIKWSLSDLGSPIIEGAIATIHCTKAAEYDSGDHVIVVGSVVDVRLGDPGMPLLFHRGQFGTVAMPPASAMPPAF